MSKKQTFFWICANDLLGIIENQKEYSRQSNSSEPSRQSSLSLHLNFNEMQRLFLHENWPKVQFVVNVWNKESKNADEVEIIPKINTTCILWRKWCWNLNYISTVYAKSFFQNCFLVSLKLPNFKLSFASWHMLNLTLQMNRIRVNWLFNYLLKEIICFNTS